MKSLCLPVFNYSVVTKNKHTHLNLYETFDNQYLTTRQIDVLKCVVLGYSAKKIASKLKISVRTAETYIEILKAKLRCHTKSELIEKVIRSGLANVLLFKDF